MTGQEKTRQELANLAPPPEQLPALAVDNGEKSLYFNPAKFEQAFRASKLLASSQLVPEQYRGQSQNCFIALQVADRMQIDPFLYMQNTYVVHGKPGLNGALAIALINKSGPFIEPIAFEYKGAYGVDRRCKATGILESGRECTAVVTWEMVKAEGWLSNSKWTSIPDQMLSYRSAAFLGRLYCPEVLMGMQTVEELIDAGPSVDAGAPEELPVGNEGLKAHLSKTVDNEALGEAIETEQPQCPEDFLPEGLRDKVSVYKGPLAQMNKAQEELNVDKIPEAASEQLQYSQEKLDQIQKETEAAYAEQASRHDEKMQPEPVDEREKYLCTTCKTWTPLDELKSRISQRKSADGTYRKIYYCPKCLVEAKVTE